jgi:hypothetical protein
VPLSDKECQKQGEADNRSRRGWPDRFDKQAGVDKDRFRLVLPKMKLVIKILRNLTASYWKGFYKPH